MKKELSFIDRQAKQWAVDFFGEKPMEKITDSQIEEARVYAFSELAKMTEKYGRMPKGTVQELFCNRLFEMYI